MSRDYFTGCDRARPGLAPLDHPTCPPVGAPTMVETVRRFILLDVDLFNDRDDDIGDELADREEAP